MLNQDLSTIMNQPSLNASKSANSTVNLKYGNIASNERYETQESASSNQLDSKYLGSITDKQLRLGNY